MDTISEICSRYRLCRCFHPDNFCLPIVDGLGSNGDTRRLFSVRFLIRAKANLRKSMVSRCFLDWTIVSSVLCDSAAFSLVFGEGG